MVLNCFIVFDESRREVVTTDDLMIVRNLFSDIEFEFPFSYWMLYIDP